MDALTNIPDGVDGELCMRISIKKGLLTLHFPETSSLTVMKVGLSEGTAHITSKI